MTITLLHTLHPILSDNVTLRAASSRVTSAWKWYVVRSAGFLAAGLLVLLMISGIGLVTGLTYRVFEPTKAWIVHKALAFALLFAIATHVIFLVLDKIVPFNIAQVLIPFIATYKKMHFLGVPIGSFMVGLGILAMYGVVIIVLSSLGYVNWIEKKKSLWKLLHYLGYIVMTFVFFHALYSGTDLAKGILRFLWIVLGLILVVALVTRLLRARVLNRRSKK